MKKLAEVSWCLNTMCAFSRHESAPDFMMSKAQEEAQDTWVFVTNIKHVFMEARHCDTMWQSYKLNWWKQNNYLGLNFVSNFVFRAQIRWATLSDFLPFDCFTNVNLIQVWFFNWDYAKENNKKERKKEKAQIKWSITAICNFIPNYLRIFFVHISLTGQNCEH